MTLDDILKKLQRGREISDNITKKTGDVLNSVGWGLAENIVKPITKATYKTIDNYSARKKALEEKNLNMSPLDKYIEIKKDTEIDNINNLVGYANKKVNDVLSYSDKKADELAKNNILRGILLGANKKVNNEQAARNIIKGSIIPNDFKLEENKFKLKDTIDERKYKSFTNKELQNVLDSNADEVAPNKLARGIGNLAYEGAKMYASTKLSPMLVYGTTGALEEYGRTDDDPDKIIASGLKDATYGTIMRGTSNLAKTGMTKVLPNVGKKWLPTVVANYGSNYAGGFGASALTDVGYDLITGEKTDPKQILENANKSGLMSGIIGGTTDIIRDAKLSKIRFNKDVNSAIENLQNINRQITEGDVSISKNPKIINKLLEKGNKEIETLSNNNYLMKNNKIKETIDMLKKAYDTGHINDIKIANNNFIGLLGTAEMNLKSNTQNNNIAPVKFENNDVSTFIKRKNNIPISEEVQLKNDLANFSKQIDNIDDGIIKKYRDNPPRLQSPNDTISTINNIIPSRNNYVNNAKNSQENVKVDNLNKNKTAIPISEEIQIKGDIENFSKQVDNVKNGTFPKRDMLTLLSNTPKVLQDIGLSNYPITMTQRHLDTIMNADGKYKNANYHNLGEDIVKQLPKAIANPLDIVHSNTAKNSIVLTTYLADKNNNTVVASIKIDGKGFINDIVIDTNVMTSAYGRKNYDKFMQDNIKKGNLLYDVDQGIIKKLSEQGFNYLDDSTSKEASPVQQLTGYTSTINNIIPRGENYVNNSENNQKSTENAPFNPEFKEKQRKRYKTIIESDLVSKEAKMVAKELMGVDTYIPESNVNQLRKADYTIEQLGTEKALDTLKNKINGGQKITGDDIALGDRLIQYYSKTGEKAGLQDAIQYTAMAGTEAGRTVQAMSIIAHQSPEGQSLWIQRSIDKLNQKIATKKGAKIEVIGGKKVAIKNGKNLDLQLFEFTADMQEKLMSVKSNEEMYSVLDEIYEELGQQVPKSTMEKIDSWRYFSMLANPTTHVRNVAGNTAMTGIQGVKNVVAGGIEDVVSLFNKDMERSKSVIRVTNINKATVKFAMDDIKNVADRLGLNQNKYSPTSRIESNKREFKSGILNKTLGNAYKLNSKFLEVEDGWGLKFNYTKELTEYIVANKYDVNNITDEQLGKARNYAIEKAKEATFHQESKLASAINQIGNNNEITKFILDSTLPFKAVPINVAKTGLEYSPLQIVKSATVDIANLRNGKINVNQYIDNVAKGLTGTGIAIVGYALAQAGILKASGSDDDKEKYDEKQGKQSYSIQIGGNTYSLSWLAPTAIPLFIGVEIAENMNNDKNENSSISSDDDSKYNKAIKSATNILDAFTNCMNPMTEMSMLSGITSTLKSYDQGSTQFLTSLGTNITKSYVNQFVPTALGKVARLTDDYERDTTSTKKGVLPKAIDSTINQTMNKIPGLRQMLPTKKDVWGNEVKQTNNIALKVFENTLAPYTRKEISSDKVDKELNILYDKTKENSIIPKNISKDFIIDGQRYKLTNKEYNEYQTQYGKTTHKTITDVMESSTYKSLSDSEKANIIKEIYNDTKEILKKKFADEHKLEYKRSDTDIKIDELVDNGLNIANAYVYKTIVNKIQGDKDKDGKSISGSEATKKVEYIYNMKDNDTQKDKMLSLISDTDTKPTMSDLKKLNGNYLTYLQQSGKKDDKGVSQRDKYMMYVDTEIPVKTLNKYYNEIGKIEGVKDKNGKTISGSKKRAIFKYINSLPLSVTQKKILFTKSNSSYGKSYKREIFNYINKLPISKARKEQIWKELYD